MAASEATSIVTASGTAVLPPPMLTMGAVVAPMVVHYTRTPQELRARASDLFTWASSGDLAVAIGGRYPLARAGEAISALTSRTTTGKLLLTH